MEGNFYHTEVVKEMVDIDRFHYYLCHLSYPILKLIENSGYYGGLILTVFSDKAERLLAEAASFGSQLVVFPEAFVGGYPRGSNFGVTIGNRTAKGKEEFRKYHAAAIDVPGMSFCVWSRQS
ncbi:hypothetical protein CsSME_00046702 [Camellia sinensis var. sinensis]